MVAGKTEDVSGFWDQWGNGISFTVGLMIAWRLNLGQSLYARLKGGIMARAKAKLKMHYRVGANFTGHPLARCGKRMRDKNITTARARVTCGTCISGMKRDQLNVRDKRR